MSSDPDKDSYPREFPVSEQGCGFHCLPGVKAGLISSAWSPAVSEGCVCTVQWLFAEPVGFSWLREGSRSWRCCHSSQRSSLWVGRLCPVCTALPPSQYRHLEQQILCSLTEDGRRDALSTLIWLRAKLLTSPAASKSNTGGLLQKIASPGMLVCCRAGV